MENHNNKIFNINDTNELLTLIDIYLSEWSHRDSSLWKQVFTYFFSILVVSTLPFTKIWGIDFDSLIPKWIYPIIGLALSVLFFIISTGYAVRLEAVGNIYKDLIKMLPQKYRRKETGEMGDGAIYKVIDVPLTKLLTRVMFILLIALNIILLYISIKLEFVS